MGNKTLLQKLISWLPVGKVEELSPAEIHQLLKQGNIQLLDVRTQSEWENYRIEGAVNVPIHTPERRT